jgi:hypothetical protein
MNTNEAEDNRRTVVRHFRQILLWPLQLIPAPDSDPRQSPWEEFERSGPSNPWREISGEFGEGSGRFHTRHYSEFTTFMPTVQRFLYGENPHGRRSAWHSESPVRVFRRTDVVRIRVTYRRGGPSVVFSVGHVELYFFYDIDVILLAVEIFADDIDLQLVQHTLYGFGRAYPLEWEPDGTASHCLDRVEWLDAGGEILSASDYEQADRYLDFVDRYRAPRIADHWEFLLRPLALYDSGDPGQMGYRQIEYHRMPLAAYLAVDDPAALTIADFIRLGLAAAPGCCDELPYSDGYLDGFEQRYCYDRYWKPGTADMSTRFICTGSTLLVIGNAAQPRFIDLETGILGQFRHQYFLLFLIAHFHRAALLMFSERLVNAINRLDIRNTDSVRQFKRCIRLILEVFLRFTHRYWFHEISDQAQAKELFRMCAEHLDTDELFNDVREEVQDMGNYLDSDTLRRQSNSMLRLTVVTIMGMTASITSGFLGMNLVDKTHAPYPTQLLYFLAGLLPALFITVFAVLRSRRLSDLLDILSDERMPARSKYSAVGNVFRKRRS